MNYGHRSFVPLWTALLVGALLLGGGARSLWAQTCPSISLSITRTTAGGSFYGANQNAGLDGTVEVMFTGQGGWDQGTWASRYLLNVYGADGTLVWQTQGITGSLTTGESYFDWNTGSMRRPYDPQNPLLGAYQPPVGDFQVEVQIQLRLWGSGTWACTYTSPRVTRTLGNPLTAEALPSDELSTVCGPNHPHLSTGSETDPQDGGQSWSIPVTT